MASCPRMAGMAGCENGNDGPRRGGNARPPPAMPPCPPPVIPVKTGIHASAPSGSRNARASSVIPPARVSSPRHSPGPPPVIPVKTGIHASNPDRESRNARVIPPLGSRPLALDRAPIPAIPGRRLSRLWWSRIGPGGPSRGIARCPPPPAGCSGCFPWPWGRLWPERWLPERSCPGR